MKKTLRFTSAALTLALAAGMALPAFAEGEKGEANITPQTSTASRLRMFFIGTLLYAAPARSARLRQPGCHRALHERKQLEFSSIVAQPTVFEKVSRIKKDHLLPKATAPGGQLPGRRAVSG